MIGGGNLVRPGLWRRFHLCLILGYISRRRDGFRFRFLFFVRFVARWSNGLCSHDHLRGFLSKRCLRCCVPSQRDNCSKSEISVPARLQYVTSGTQTNDRFAKNSVDEIIIHFPIALDESPEQSHRSRLTTAVIAQAVSLAQNPQ